MQMPWPPYATGCSCSGTPPSSSSPRPTTSMPACCGCSPISKPCWRLRGWAVIDDLAALLVQVREQDVDAILTLTDLVEQGLADPDEPVALALDLRGRARDHGRGVRKSGTRRGGDHQAQHARTGTTISVSLRALIYRWRKRRKRLSPQDRFRSTPVRYSVPID